MPFELKIERVEREGGEVAVTGRLTQGFYAGPEFVLVHDVAGQMWRTPIATHSMQYLDKAAWPITAGQETLLTLYLPLPKDVLIDASKPVVGIGNDVERGAAEDYGQYLDDPRFWSVLLHETMSTETGDADYGLLSTSLQASSAFFNGMLAAIATGRTPTLRFELDADWALAWTVTEGAEYRQTLILEDRRGKREITLGWLSGHFANPSLRPQELAEIAKRLATAGYAPRDALVFAEFCGGDGSAGLSPDIHRNRLAPLFRALPGTDEAKAEALYKSFSEYTFTETPDWRFDEVLGWVNDYRHSRRNPTAPGCLTADEFAAVLAFFGR